MKRVFAILGTLGLFGSGLSWFFVFAYADWLRFYSPRNPNPATGQIVFVKAVKGVFYATPAQAWWAQTALLYVWITGACCLVLVWLSGGLKGAATGSEGDTAFGQSRFVKYASGVGTVLFFLLMFFGDHVMAFLFTGSFRPPAVRP